MHPAPQLALGTAQFGSPYGVTRRGSGPSERDVHAILGKAAATGLTMIDTAAVYGLAEQRIGRYLATAQSPLQWQIVTKLPPNCAAGDVMPAIHQSLDRLSVSQIYGIMVHRATTLSDSCGEPVWRALVHARDAGLVERVGVSLYTPEELEAVRAVYPVDLVQLPFNLFDRRFQGQIEALVDAGVEVHLRSALLQGVLALPATALPSFLCDLAADQQRFLDLMAAHGVRPLTGALRLCAAVGCQRIVVGCQNLEEFDDLIAASFEGPKVPEKVVSALLDPAWAKPARLVDPRFWPTQPPASL